MLLIFIFMLSIPTCPLQGNTAGLVAGAFTGAVQGLFFCPGHYDYIFKKNEFIQRCSAVLIAATIMCCPVLACGITTFIDNSEEAKKTAIHTDFVVGILAACIGKYAFSKHPFNFHEDITWPAIVFSVLKLPAFCALSSIDD